MGITSVSLLYHFCIQLNVTQGSYMEMLLFLRIIDMKLLILKTYSLLTKIIVSRVV